MRPLPRESAAKYLLGTDAVAAAIAGLLRAGEIERRGVYAILRFMRQQVGRNRLYKHAYTSTALMWHELDAAVREIGYIVQTIRYARFNRTRRDKARGKP